MQTTHLLTFTIVQSFTFMELVQAAFSIDSSETGKCCVVSAWGDVQGYGKDYKTVNIKLTQNRADE